MNRTWSLCPKQLVTGKKLCMLTYFREPSYLQVRMPVGLWYFEKQLQIYILCVNSLSLHPRDGRDYADDRRPVSYTCTKIRSRFRPRMTKHVSVDSTLCDAMCECDLAYNFRVVLTSSDDSVDVQQQGGDTTRMHKPSNSKASSHHLKRKIRAIGVTVN